MSHVTAPNSALPAGAVAPDPGADGVVRALDSLKEQDHAA